MTTHVERMHRFLSRHPDLPPHIGALVREYAKRADVAAAAWSVLRAQLRELTVTDDELSRLVADYSALREREERFYDQVPAALDEWLYGQNVVDDEEND